MSSLPPGMNKTEISAYKWLKRNGHAGIKFTRRGTPDFITDKGGFEVKRIYGKNTITFSPKQRSKIVEAQAKILVFFSDNDEKPLTILDWSDLSDMKSPGTTVEKSGILIHIFGGHDDEAIIRIRNVRPDVHIAFKKWVMTCMEKTGNPMLTEGEAFEELLRSEGMLPPRGKVF